MNQEILDEAKSIMDEYKSEKAFSQKAKEICNGAALNKIASGSNIKSEVPNDNKQRTD